MASTIRIGLLDTDSDVRFGRKLVLSSEPEFEVVFDSDGSQDDLEAIEQSLIDVLVVDQRLFSGAGVSFYSSLRNLVGPKQAPPAVLTASFAQPDLLLDALQGGMFDVVSVDQGAQGLVAAVSKATTGVTAYSLSAACLSRGRFEFRKTSRRITSEAGQWRKEAKGCLDIFGFGQDR